MTRPSPAIPIALSMALLSLCGCTAAQVTRNGIGLRQAMLDLYTDQALDNLVRAKTYQPFAQLNYRDLLVQDTDTLFGQIGNAQTVGDMGQLTLAAALSRAFTHSVSNTLSPMGNAQRQAQLSFHADIVTDQNDIYEAYMKFAEDPGLFMVSDCKPPGRMRYMKKYSGQYFFVPPQAEPAFQQLVLKTTFMRGKPTPTYLGYYEAKVVGVTSRAGDPAHPDLKIVTVQLDTPIPNGTATMVLLFPGGKSARLSLSPQAVPDALAPDFKDYKDVPLGQPTNRFDAAWNHKNLATAFEPENLQNVPVRVFSHDYPPPAPPGPNIAAEIRDDLDRVRAIQTNLVGSTTR